MDKINFLLGLFMAANSTICLYSQNISKYDIWELEVINSNSYTNKFNFNEIELDVTFTSPTNREITYYGFYDGDGNGGQTGNVWKIRFMPDEVGTWDYVYTWSDATTGGSGSFTVVSSSIKGWIQKDQNNPHHFVYANGEHFFWNGETGFVFLSHLFTQQDRFDAIDFLGTHRVNNLLMTMVNDDTYDVYPWLTRSDKDHFNLSRMQDWETVIEYMQQYGIIADLWFYSDGSQSLIPSANSAEEDLYFKYIIARFASYWNVCWNLALEYSEYRNSAWVISRAQDVKDLDPYNHVLAVHQLPSESYDFPGNINLDHTSLQRNGGGHSLLNGAIISNRASTTSAGNPIPICHEEFFIEGSKGNLTQARQGMWSIVAGGGYYKMASLGWWVGTYYTSGQHFDYADYLYDFINQTHYWRFVPHNEYVISGIGYCTALPDTEYVVYLPSGGSMSLDLSGASGIFDVEWYNPRDGSTTVESGVNGGGSVNFASPDNNDWTLHLVKQSNANIKIYLEGPYDAGGDSMRTDINASIPLAHPYSNSPWNYQSFSVSSIPDSIVDWVLVAIRSDTAAISAVDTTAGFLTRSGMIVDTSGNGPIKFNALAGYYFIVVYHRNHLAVMSAAKQALSSSSSLYDFTTGTSQFFGGDAALLETGVYGMYGGDGESDDDTDASDINLVWRPQNGTGWLYTKYGDYDMDGDIDASDVNLVWRPNNGKGTQVPQ